jgi:hypothetical protein
MSLNLQNVPSALTFKSVAFCPQNVIYTLRMTLKIKLRLFSHTTQRKDLCD